MKKTPKHISKADQERIEKEKDRRVQYFLGIATLLGPSICAIVEKLLSLI